MISGLHVFKEHFKNYTDNFVLIGGSACEINMSKLGLSFRRTKDLDIVLFVEAIDREFINHFKEFVRRGGYENREHSGKKEMYRFIKPKNEDFPFMLELFSRSEIEWSSPPSFHLTPIKLDGEDAYMSAILLDNEYYSFIKQGKVIVDGIPVLRAEYLIPLKAKAWIDLSRKKSRDENIHSSDIKKHKNDIFRLLQIVDPTFDEEIPPTIKSEMMNFITLISNDEIDLRSLKIHGSKDELVDLLIRVYGQ